jgi:hypothetical protein
VTPQIYPAIDRDALEAKPDIPPAGQTLLAQRRAERRMRSAWSMVTQMLEPVENALIHRSLRASQFRSSGRQSAAATSLQNASKATQSCCIASVKVSGLLI